MEIVAKNQQQQQQVKEKNLWYLKNDGGLPDDDVGNFNDSYYKIIDGSVQYH